MMEEDNNNLWDEQIEISFQDYDLSPTSPTEEKLIQICGLDKPLPNYSNFPSVETASQALDMHRIWPATSFAPKPWWNPYQTWSTLNTSLPEEDSEEVYEYGDEIDLKEICSFFRTESCSPSPTLLSTLIELPLEKLEETITAFLDEDSWFNLVCTTKILSEIKKRTVLWRLNSHFSVQYYLNPDWKELFLQRVHNPESQVCLYLSGRVWISPSLSEVEGDDNDDTKKKQQLHAWTPKSEKEAPLTKEQIYLQRVNHVHYLDISHNDGLKDVSPLTSVYRINASNCSDLVDITSLKGCHFVDISHCPKIIDFTAVQNISVLLARGNHQIESVMMFANIRKVDLSGCSNIRDVSPLANVQALKLNDCEKVMNFHTLVNNESLNISQNKSLRYLPAITYKTIRLKLNDCPNVERLDPLWQRFLSTTTEEEEDSFTSPLNAIQSRTSFPISSLKSIQVGLDDSSSAQRSGRTTFGDTVSSLTSMETTNAIGSERSSSTCEELESVQENSELRELWLAGCHNIRSLAGLTVERFPKLETVYICRCMKILAKFPFLQKRVALHPCKNKKRVVSELHMRRLADRVFPRGSITEDVQMIREEVSDRRELDLRSCREFDPDNCQRLLLELQHQNARFKNYPFIRPFDDDRMTINL